MTANDAGIAIGSAMMIGFVLLLAVICYFNSAKQADRNAKLIFFGFCLMFNFIDISLLWTLVFVVLGATIAVFIVPWMRKIKNQYGYKS